MDRFVPELPQFGYFEPKKANTFSGGHGDLRYRIVPNKADNTLILSIWPNPYTLEYTPPERVEEQTYPLTEEGLQEISARLTERYDQFLQQIKSGELVIEHPFGVR